MTIARIVFAAGLALALTGLAQPAEARHHTSFQLHTPGFSLHIGKYPRYYYRPYYYGPYYSPYYYRPYTYKRRYRRYYRASRCARWRSEEHTSELQSH